MDVILPGGLICTVTILHWHLICTNCLGDRCVMKLNCLGNCCVLYGYKGFTVCVYCMLVKFITSYEASVNCMDVKVILPGDWCILGPYCLEDLSVMSPTSLGEWCVLYRC